MLVIYNELLDNFSMFYSFITLAIMCGSMARITTNGQPLSLNKACIASRTSKTLSCSQLSRPSTITTSLLCWDVKLSRHLTYFSKYLKLDLMNEFMKFKLRRVSSLTLSEVYKIFEILVSKFYKENSRF